MPEGQDYECFRREEIHSFEEITKFVKAIIPLGIKKVRLTGGEPLLRRDLERLIKMLSLNLIKSFVENTSVSLTLLSFIYAPLPLLSLKGLYDLGKGFRV